MFRFRLSFATASRMSTTSSKPSSNFRFCSIASSFSPKGGEWQNTLSGKFIIKYSIILKGKENPIVLFHNVYFFTISFCNFLKVTCSIHGFFLYSISAILIEKGLNRPHCSLRQRKDQTSIVYITPQKNVTCHFSSFFSTLTDKCLVSFTWEVTNRFKLSSATSISTSSLH